MIFKGLNLVKLGWYMLLIFTSLIFIKSVFAEQELAEDQIKAIYVYNFIKHIEWPSEKNNKTFTIAVYRDESVFSTFNSSLAKQKIKGINISIIAVSNAAKARDAQVLYIPNNYNFQLAEIASTVRSSQTLLITNDSQNKHDVMINLIFNAKTSLISFEVNRSNIVFEQLEISLDLLMLGGTELDVATLYRETQKAMQVIKAQEVVLNKELAEQKQQITNSSSKLKNVNNKLSRSANELLKYKSEFKKVEAGIVKQRQELVRKEQELGVVLSELSAAKKNHAKQQQEAKNSQSISNELIAENKTILEQQKNSIAEHQVKLKSQTAELVGSKATIDNQKATIFVTSFLIIVALLVVILVVFLLINNRRTTLRLTNTINRLEQTKEQLIESEKMASLGSLVAGVAHEINTPLGIAVTSTSLICEKTEDIERKLNEKTLSQSDLVSFIEVVKKSSHISNTGLDRVIVLLGNFKQVAADQIIEEARKINLAEYTDEVFTTLIGEMKSKKVTYQLSGDKDINITTIPGALAQVITNLVTNSVRHGFEDRMSGNISIELSRDENSSINFVYKDDGCGIKSSHINKVFDPFFTTKRNNGGTGLGMNIVYNIIHQKLAGNITLESNYGEGSVFTITLPEHIEQKTAI